MVSAIACNQSHSVRVSRLPTVFHLQFTWRFLPLLWNGDVSDKYIHCVVASFQSAAKKSRTITVIYFTHHVFFFCCYVFCAGSIPFRTILFINRSRIKNLPYWNISTVRLIGPPMKINMLSVWLCSLIFVSFFGESSMHFHEWASKAFQKCNVCYRKNAKNIWASVYMRSCNKCEKAKQTSFRRRKSKTAYQN